MNSDQNKPHPILTGSNITRISQHAGIDLVSTYWKLQLPLLTDHVLVVGDIHGDIHQFIAPLVMSGLITITGNVRFIANEDAYPCTIFQGSDKDKTFIPKLKHYDELTLYVPEYRINTSCKSKIIFLGDFANEFLFVRVILYMLVDLIKTVPDNIVYLYGNHDNNIFTQYPLFQRKLLDMNANLNSTYLTMTNELNMFRSLHFYEFKTEYENDLEKGKDFEYAYISHIIEPLYWIYKNMKGHLCFHMDINGIPYMFTHTVWNMLNIPAFALEKNLDNHLRFSHYSVYSRLGDHKCSQESKRYMMEIFMTAGHIAERNKYEIDKAKLIQLDLDSPAYDKIQDAMNDIYHGSTCVSLNHTQILYNRTINNSFLNQITGHTPGFVWRDIGINIAPCTYAHERLKFLHPTIVNNKEIYYWDFMSSAGYDVNECSRPDFVYFSNDVIGPNKKSSENVFLMSNLPSFNFIIHNGKDTMLICASKSRRVGEVKKISIEDKDDSEDADADSDESESESTD